MRHQPHLWLPGPWNDGTIAVTDDATRHLTKVLRYPIGGPVTYTDGEGVVGTGEWTGSAVLRGAETSSERLTPVVTIAVAPPKSRDRQRTIVEKLQELGVAHLVWLETEHGEGRPPKPERSAAWVTSAVEQSRRTWRMTIATARLADLEDPIMADSADQELPDAYGDRSAVTVAIGPEGGWSADERATSTVGVRLSDGVLRTDTAAIVAAAAFVG